MYSSSFVFQSFFLLPGIRILAEDQELAENIVQNNNHHGNGQLADEKFQLHQIHHDKDRRQIKKEGGDPAQNE